VKALARAAPSVGGERPEPSADPLLGDPQPGADRQRPEGEGRQNLLCAGLAVGVLAGLLANTTLGVWWFDPAVGLVIAAGCLFAGRESWRGESCACTQCAVPTVPASS
jgi:hypothetical protein